MENDSIVDPVVFKGRKYLRCVGFEFFVSLYVSYRVAHAGSVKHNKAAVELRATLFLQNSIGFMDNLYKSVSMARIVLAIFLFTPIALSASYASTTDTVRLLMIGSREMDTRMSEYLLGLTAARGIPTVMGNVYVEEAESTNCHGDMPVDEPICSYRKTGSGKTVCEMQKIALSKVLIDEPWNYVLFCPFGACGESSEKKLGGYAAWIADVRRNVNRRTEFAVCQPWTFEDVALSEAAECDLDRMYAATVYAAGQIAEEAGIELIVPCGIAMRNMLTTFVGDRLNEETCRLDPVVEYYTAACVWFEVFTGRSVVGNPYVPMGIKYDLRETTQAVAHAAMADPLCVTDMVYFKDPPSLTNYDETKVPDYVLPDPLVMQNGRRVTSVAQWVKKRRPELVALFESEMYGRAPGAPAGLHFEILTEDRNAFNGLATRREVAVCFTRDGKERMTLLLYVPNDRKGAVPLFFGLNFMGNPTVCSDPGISYPSPDEQREFRWKEVPERGSASSRWPIEMILRNGYGLATVYRDDIAPDFDDNLATGVRALYKKKGEVELADDQWGTIAAWAWGMSRAMDYFETDDDVDATRVIAIGHSRLGKTALWAAAVDERFAMVVSNASGCGGAALSRRAYGETVRVINGKFPYWFCGNFKKYNEREEMLPFDQHELIALIAPRPIYIASGSEDRWADQKGEFLGGLHASPVYELFGLKGLDAETPPAVDSPVQSGRIAYHIRTGEHDITYYDWTQYIRFADKFFKNE